MQKSLTGLTVAGKYLVGPVVGKGSFGEVYISTVQGQSKVYAIKKEISSNHFLHNEAKILKFFTNVVGFPQVYWLGHENNSNLLVMDLLGPSLQSLFNICQRKFSLKTVLMLADQMIHKLEIYHSMNFVHRDLKPQNFLLGIEGSSHIVYFIDYGLSKRYRDPKTSQHYPYKENRGIAGTIRFSSLNTHYGFEQSRRDDMEALGYILVYFLQGGLPWQGVKANSKAQKNQKILQKKLSMPAQVLCLGLPIQFATYLNYCRTLKFQQRPDYKFLRKTFRQLFDRFNYTWDYDFDWCHFDVKKQAKMQNMQLIIQKKDVEIHNIGFEMAAKNNQNVIELNESDINITVQNSDLLLESNMDVKTSGDGKVKPSVASRFSANMKPIEGNRPSMEMKSRGGNQLLNVSNVQSNDGSQNLTSQNISNVNSSKIEDGSQNLPDQTLIELDNVNLNAHNKNGVLKSFESNFKSSW